MNPLYLHKPVIWIGMKINTFRGFEGTINVKSQVLQFICQEVPLPYNGKGYVVCYELLTLEE